MPECSPDPIRIHKVLAQPGSTRRPDPIRIHKAPDPVRLHKAPDPKDSGRHRKHLPMKKFRSDILLLAACLLLAASPAPGADAPRDPGAAQGVPEKDDAPPSQNSPGKPGQEAEPEICAGANTDDRPECGDTTGTPPEKDPGRPAADTGSTSGGSGGGDNAADQASAPAAGSSKKDSSARRQTPDPESRCLRDASAIVIHGSTTLDRTGTFAACLRAASGSNPLIWYFTGHMMLNAIGAKPNTAEGLKWLEKAALKGLPQAQSELADYYMTGGGVKKKVDMPKALEWLSRLASDRTSAYGKEAAFRLCSIYLFGTGTEPDHQRAFTWCRISGLEQQNYEGLTNLALLHINGWGTPKNAPLALDYYETAAKRGVISAQLSLGRAYSMGSDVPADYGRAFHWMKKAADQDSPQGLYYLAQMYEYGQGTDQNDKLAWKTYHKAALLGEPRAQYALGRLYQHAENPNIDYAAKWYHKAAAAGNTDAMIAIGDLYSSQNQREMMRWYAAAAHGGSSDGKLRMIPHLLKGSRDVKADPALALKYAAELADTGNSRGMYWMGVILLRGLAGEKRPLEALEAFALSAGEGDADAALELGRGLIRGDFGTPDPRRGETFLLQAAENGCINDACLELARLYATRQDYASAQRWISDADCATADDRAACEQLASSIAAALADQGGGQP